MKDMGHRTCVECALKHEISNRTPVNNFAVVTSARSAGISVDDARWHPEVSAKVSIDYALKTHSDFVKPVLDSQIVFADMGMDVRFPSDDYGFIKKHAVETEEDIDGLAFFDPSKAKECPQFTTGVVEALKETSKMLEEDLHICGLSWGPFSTAGYLMGTEQMLMQFFMDPGIVQSLLKKVTPFISAQEKVMIDAGATLMWMADPTSSEDMISPDMFKEYSYDPIKTVIDDVKKNYDVPAFVHICGRSLEIMPMLSEIGVDCFSFDHAVDISKARSKAGKKLALMGNVDPVGLILSGTPEQITKECYRCIDTAGRDGGLILAPGCETPQASPDANVIAMGRAGVDYWKQ